jgi:hypothetical protein
VSGGKIVGRGLSKTYSPLLKKMGRGTLVQNLPCPSLSKRGIFSLCKIPLL